MYFPGPDHSGSRSASRRRLHRNGRLRGPINLELAAIPVIVVSGRDLRGNKERALKVGAAAFLAEAVDDDELLSLIAGLLGQPAVYGESCGIPVWDANETLTPFGE